MPLNLEMAATEEMLQIALKYRPHAACIVPEKREERTTEGGLDVAAGYQHLMPFVNKLSDANIRVSLFIEADVVQLEAAAKLGVPVVELHTGAYCDAHGSEKDQYLNQIIQGAKYSAEIGLECHAGHGLNFDTVSPIAALPQIVELNIGHFLIGEAIFGGLEGAIMRMRSLMEHARAEANGT